jgi:hypothetical protein
MADEFFARMALVLAAHWSAAPVGLGDEHATEPQTGGPLATWNGRTPPAR